jgi:hypothetical protein
VRNYLHIGSDIILPSAEIIGIFSSIADNSGIMDVFRKNFRLKNISQENKSFVLCAGSGREYIHFSGISAKRLIRRAQTYYTGGTLYGRERKE